MFRNPNVADNPAGCVAIFGYQEVLEFLQVRYEWVGDIIMQTAGGKEGAENTLNAVLFVSCS